ncbi:hypothetical protein [Acidicapsa ligni]|uniref:hypothetical protein n=1 Tax=Acidicapsa ligni TaxID=542300 RepID=UPI0021DFBFAE|nr:hypothetical protein [Acidicapsa ligni]
MRKLIELSCLAVVTHFAGAFLSLWAEAPLPPRVPAPDSATLVREVVYNELHDHDTHGYWRYWVQRHASKETHGNELEQQVETPDGAIKRIELIDGHPLSTDAREAQESALQHLLSSPSEQAQHRKEYAEDERRIGRIVALLPDAFLYEPAQEQMLQQGLCYHMRFHPNPAYPAHSIEARIFHAMSGDLWISVQNKRLVRLDGKLEANVDFGYGILGRLYKDGWFQLERTHVGGRTGASAAAGDWKTQRLEVHMIGRAMLFKTIARETSEVRGGFTAVPANISLRDAAALIRQPIAAPSAESVALVVQR